MKENTNLAIIGSGVGGLACAYFLLKKNPKLHVEIFEKGNVVGGLAAPISIQGTKLEKFYHHIFTTDKEIMNLITELGIEDKLHWYKDNRATYWGNTLYPFLGAKDLLLFSPLPFLSRFRVGLITYYLMKTKNWKKFENTTASSWLSKYMGKKAYEIFWQPVLFAKFQKYFDKITMSWVWSRIETRGNSKGKLGYMDGSFGTLFDTLEKKVRGKGGMIQTNMTITGIEKTNEGVILTFNDNSKKVFDKVIITTPSHVYTKLLHGLTEEYIHNVNSIDYISAQTIILTLKEKLTDYYWITVADTKQPALVIVEQTNMVEGYNGKHIIYVGNYLQNDSEILTMSDDALKKIYYPFLKKLNKNFKDSWVEDFQVFRAPFAQPIVTTEYHTHIPAVQSPIEDVYILNMSQVYPEDRGMNFAVKNAFNLAKNIQ